MPELPEVETVKRQLTAVLIGQSIKSVKVLRDKSFIGSPQEVIGSELISINRKGKMLVIEVRSKETGVKEEKFILIHLKMTGQLIYQTHNGDSDRIVGGHPNNSWTNQLPDSHTRVIIELSEGTLFFNDQRVFGWVKVVTTKELEVILSKMPPDIIDPEVTTEFLYTLVKRSNRPIKLVIMDSSRLGGVGNIYANDALWDAGIHPYRKANTLTKVETKRLLESMKKVVNLGIELGGATAADRKFVNTQGFGGKYQDFFLTYERRGLACKREDCSGVIEKISIGGRGSYFCPVCQK